MPYLTPAEARRVYDRSGLWREAQAFYVRPALDELIARADFEQAAFVLGAALLEGLRFGLVLGVNGVVSGVLACFAPGVRVLSGAWEGPKEA